MAAAAAVQQPLSLSLAPISRPQLIDAAYPTSPISNFPPFPPSLRRPLRVRERRGASAPLSIVTSFSHHAHDAGLWSPKGHIQPHRSHLPRRRKVKKFTPQYDEDPEPEPRKEQKHAEEIAAAAIAEPAEAPVSPPLEAKQDPLLPIVPLKDHAIQELVPGLFIGFSSPTTQLSLQDGGYTHIIQIVGQHATVDPSQATGSNATEQTYDGRVQRLRLTLPNAAQAETQRAGLGLSDAQLRASRDFLAQALPYSSVSQGEPSGIRIMVATPFGRPTDAMCVAGCYLAFVSGKSVGDVLRFVDEEEDFMSVWKGEVSEDEVERTERVARMWSWLSTVVRR